VLVDRDGRYPEVEQRLEDLRGLLPFLMLD
jgi:hypothetical protein